MASIQFDGLAIPEIIVRKLLDQLIAALIADSSLLDKILVSYPAEDVDSFRTALVRRSPGNTARRVRYGFALENVEDWQITIMLSSSAPPANTRTLGDLASDPVRTTTHTDTISTALGAVENPGGVKGEAIDLAAGLAALEASASPLRGRCLIAGQEIATYWIDPGVDVRLIRRGLLRNEGGVAATAWPIGTTIEFQTINQRHGESDIASVRADVLSSNTWFTMILSRIVKAYLLANRDAFDVEGLTLHQVEETDLAPRPAAWPAHLYSRTLNLSVRHMVALPVEIPVVTDAEVSPPLTIETGVSDGEVPSEFQA